MYVTIEKRCNLNRHAHFIEEYLSSINHQQIMHNIYCVEINKNVL